MTSLPLDEWDSGAENPWNQKQEEDSLLSALQPRLSPACGVKCRKAL